MHLITHEPIKFGVTKVRSKFKFVEIASEQASVVQIKAFISALNRSKSLGEMPKVRRKQKKYSEDSVTIL